MVEFGTSSAFRGWVRVRVLGYGFGGRSRKVKSRDCALASDLVKACKMQPWGVIGEKLLLSRSRDQCAANWCTNFNCSLGLGFGDGFRVRVMVEFGASSAFRGWVRVRVLGYSFGVRDRKVKSHDHHPLKAEDVPNSTITLNHPLTLGLTSNSSSCTNLPRTDHVTSMKAVFRL